MDRQETQAWIAQFRPGEQALVSDMLRKMTLVSRDEFADRMLEHIRCRVEDGYDPVGLYAEREVRKHSGKANRLFKESRTKIRRAHGVGPQPVQPVRSFDPDVGSEAIVAHLVSELEREQPKRFVSHPGPDKIRRMKVRRFILVTDFIGSGARASTYLDAAWRVKSVKSWRSSRPQHGWRFEVVAYSGTERGVAKVEGHPSRPKVTLVTACPTIFNRFSKADTERLEEICRSHCPGTAAKESLGFLETGALIAFAHGMPNNCPLVFHERTGTWEPLFPKRLTTVLRPSFQELSPAKRVRERLMYMRQLKLAQSAKVTALDPRKQGLVSVLAALSHPPRTTAHISLKTGLTLREVDDFLAHALKNAWVDGNNRLTDHGHNELRSLGQPDRIIDLPRESDLPYCPVQLRAPQVSRR